MSELPAVLVVDDRPDNLTAMTALLSSLPCRVVTVDSGPDALKQLLTDEFALVLLDVQMPGLDGYETARHIKMRERTKRLPIIFLSAIDRELHHQLRGYDSGAVDFIPKPVLPEVVCSKVSVFLELYEQARHIDGQRAALAAQVEQTRLARDALAVQAAELSRSNAELERFSAAASHDLVEPLQLAAGFLSLLEERHHGDGEEANLLLERARAAVARTVERVEALLHYAALSTDSMQLGAVNLEDVLASVLVQLSEDLGAETERITADPLPMVWGDGWQLRCLLAELLGNAIRYGGTLSDIHLGLSRREGRWIITVHDSGPGTDDAVLAAAFDLVHGPPGQVGLALCRRIVERHGGTIWAQSTPGIGTSVSFSLAPAEEPPGPPGPTAQP